MRKRIRAFLHISKHTFKEWKASDPFRQSAVIAYYAIFSLPALLVLIINFVGLFYDKDVIGDEISRQVEGVMGKETAMQIAEMVSKASETKAGLVSSIIAIVTIVTGATGVFVELQKSLDHIWGVKQRDDLNFFQKLRSQLFSFGLILAIGFLLLVSLVVSTALAAFSHWIENVFPEVVAYLFYAMELVLSVSVITLLFALMFKFLPDIKIKLRHVWSGAFFTAILFVIGKYALSFYFGKAEPASVYGAAGSIVLLLLWVSYSSMIVFFGAEFTHQYLIYHQIKVKPAKIAEKEKNAHEMEWEKNQTTQQKIKAEHDRSKEVINNHEKSSHADYQNNGHDKKQHSHKEKSSEADHKSGEKDKAAQSFAEKKFKSLADVKNEIDRMNSRLEEDKHEIVDNLKPSHLLASLVPKALRVRHELKEKLSVDQYLKHVARKHINKKEESLMDRILRIMHTND